MASSLAVREKPGTDQKVFKYVSLGDYLTRTQKNVEEKNGYIWDKVITDDGIEGYVARGEANKDYIILVTTGDVEIKGQGFKTSGMNVICEPKTTIENILAVNKDVVILDGSGKEVKSGNIGTGYTIKANGSTYTVAKKGDTNGDGRLTPADSTIILKSYVGSTKLSNAAQLAADTNGDGKLTPADSTVILRTYVGLTNISI